MKQIDTDRFPSQQVKGNLCKIIFRFVGDQKPNQIDQQNIFG